MDMRSASLSKFLKWSSRQAGNPITFVVALGILALWLIIGLVYGFTDTWLLVINTLATINASLMVFIIQNTQTRDTKALQLKLDELLYSIKEARNELIAIEELEEGQIEEFRRQMAKKKTKS